ncbi:nuclear pore complex protein Nup153-like isoform X1 [Argonauta hians]
MANRDIGGKIRSKRSYTSSKPYDRRKSFLSKFTDTVKDIFVPSWLSDFLKNNPTENSSNNVIEEEDQNGNEIKDHDDNYSSAHESTGVGDRRPAQPRPLHPEYTNYHQQMKAVSRRSAMTGYSSDHVTVNHEMQYLPGPRYSSSNHDASLPHTGQLSETGSRLSDKQNCLPLSGADIEQLKNRLQTPADNQHPSDINYQSATASVDDDEGNGSVSADPEDSCDCDSSKLWSHISYLKKNESNSFRTKPRFEPSLLVSPFMKDSLLSDSRYESSFYGGKTQYGGASSKRKMRLKETNPYSAATPYRRQVNAKPLHKNSTGAVTSSTAKRISNILDMMATPISDTRKIPISNHNLADTVLQFSPSNFKRRSRPLAAVSTFSSESEKLPPRGPPTVMMTSPSIAAIAKNRISTYKDFRSSPTIENYQKLTQHISNKESSNTKKDSGVEAARTIVTRSEVASVVKTSVTTAATITSATSSVSSPTSLPSSSSFSFSKPLSSKLPSSIDVESPPSLDRGSSSGKMKREKSYSTRGSAVKDLDEENEVPIPVNTSFVLPVKDMPKFSFGVPEAPFSKPSGTSTTVTPIGSFSSKSSTVITQTPATTSASTTTPSFSPATGFSTATSNITTTESGFKFSSPIPTTLSSTDLPPHQSTLVSDFKFSSPEKVVVDSAKPAFQFMSSSTLPKPKSPSTFEVKPASTLKTSGSVMDMLGGKKTADSGTSSSSSSSSSIFGGVSTASTLKTGSVMDILGGQEKETSKPTVDPLMAKFMKPGSWNCDTCMLQNKAEDQKCIACETPKPSAAPSKAPTTTASATTDSLMSKFLKPSGSWECSTCMLQNKSDASKCVACQTAKPSTSPAKASKPPSQPDSLMSKFILPAGSWDCDTCMLQNKAEATKCVACESPKPGSKPSLSTAGKSVLPAKAVDPLMAKFLKPDGWECGVCMLKNKESDKVCVACQSPNPKAPSQPSSSNAASEMVRCLSPTESHSVGTSNCQLDKALSVWKCDTCLVTNPQIFRKCIACDTPHIKPAVIATIAANSSGSADVLPKSGVLTSSGFKLGAYSPSESGFKLNTSVPSGSTTGFKLDTSTTTGSTTTGFKLSSTSATSSSTTTGFKLGTSTTTDPAPISSGFKFGSSTTSDSAPVSSGFKFGTSTPSDPAPVTSGFKFGVTATSDPAPTTSGFKFGSNVSDPANSGFKLGATSPQEDTNKTSVEAEKSSVQGFRFGYVPPEGENQAGTSNFKFGGNDETKEKSGYQPSSDGFVVSQTKSDFSFSSPQSTTPSTSNTSLSCTTTSAASLPTGIPMYSAAIKSSSSGFSFAGSDKTGSAAFKVPDAKTTSIPPFTFGADKSVPPVFGAATTSDASKSAGSTFTFGSDNSKSSATPSSGGPKLPFSVTSPLKRERDDETDGPSGAKRSVSSSSVDTNPATDFNFSAGSTQPSAIFSGGFKSFTDSGNKNPFSTPAATTTANWNTIPAFGSSSSNSSVNNGSSNAAAPATFSSPGFNFVPNQTTASAATVTTTSQSAPFTFGSAPTPAFGVTPASFSFRPANTTAPMFNSKPFSATTTAPASTNFTSAASSEPFSFATTGGFQFAGKQPTENSTTAAAATTAVNNNLFQFGQTPPTNANPGPLGTSTGFQFSSTPNFNFTSGATHPGNFAFSGNSDSSQPQTGRVMKKAVRRSRK